MHVAESFALEAAQRPAQLPRLLADDVGAEVAVGTRPVALVRDPLRHVEDDGHRQAVELARDLHEGLARLRLDVGGVHHGELARASRLRAMKCSSSKASGVAAWLFSSSDTRPRQTSDDRISVGLKCRRANVLLPEPDTPTRTTRESSGIVERHRAEHPHLRRRPEGRHLGADGQETTR